MGAIVEVSHLSVTARGADGRIAPIVDDVSFRIEPGEVLALIGESGSGKTTIALALMGHARRGCRIAGGSVRIGDADVLALSAAGQRDLRGRAVSYIAQSAAASFNPSRTIIDQVIETTKIHHVMPRDEAERKAVALFRELALPDPDTIGGRYPHQVSGGQLQRLMAAMALITDPDLVILDEPTTALDVTTQIEVLHAFRRVVREHNATAVYVTHDLAVVAQMADRILVLRGGRQREVGTTAHIIDAPEDEYTKSLIAAATPAVRASGAPVATRAAPLLDVRGLTAGYGKFGANGLPAAPVLTDVSFTLQRGQALGVIGESGSGKTTLARVIAGLVPPARGDVLFDGRPLGAGLGERSRDDLRRIQIVFQMADTALNPSQSIADILGRPLQLYHGRKGADLDRRIDELLDLVQLPASCRDRLPGGLSGGQKQRVNLARALAAEPDLILCDEVTSALDTVVAAAILDLMADLRRELSVSYLFISHDLNTVRAVCDDVIVLYAGRKVEAVQRAAFALATHHPYFDLLAQSVPELRRGWLEDAGASRMQPLPPVAGKRGEPGEDNEGALCGFLDRCPQRLAGACDATPPPRRTLDGGIEVLCHRSGPELATAAAGRAARTAARPTRTEHP